MTTASAHVVVGVDGSHGNVSAIAYAAQEARRNSRVLRLVHVAPNLVPLSPMMPLLPEDVVATGRAILAHARQDAVDLAPDLTIEVELRRGSRSTELSKASVDADVLVVGRDGRSFLERTMRGDTVTAVSARASCPVVSVPPMWKSDRQHRVVVVALKSTAHVMGLLDDAFAAAASTGSRLVVLHAWTVPAGYEDLVSGPDAVSQWNEACSSEIGSLLLDWREAYPQVDTQVQVVHENPVRALLHAAQSADVVVLSRRKHDIPGLMHLGRTARGVLRSAACPVRVVPPVAPDVLRGPDLDLGGTITK